jgi:hypothetical protein
MRKKSETPYEHLPNLQPTAADRLRQKAKVTTGDLVKALRKKPDYYHTDYSAKNEADMKKQSVLSEFMNIKTSGVKRVSRLNETVGKRIMKVDADNERVSNSLIGEPAHMLVQKREKSEQDVASANEALSRAVGKVTRRNARYKDLYPTGGNKTEREN